MTVPLALIYIKYLSYFSLLGIVSAIILEIVVIINGFTRNDQPGSLFNPMKTELWPTDWNSLPFSFGLRLDMQVINLIFLVIIQLIY
ncbi:hypothetical protein C2G38_2220633 [Gigaspora rosea]|uniref:Amino acid transporter transmembrane domain-containing protein n=1 Tax=Gigaspora rosea TaxID=44941 RepID=A0A397U8J3_9GLOM|nr:hypothetical protein C2G38_2220633 [Gigaspora rosea]